MMMFTVETFGACIILVANLAALQGFVFVFVFDFLDIISMIVFERLRKSEAYLLVPWLFLYIIGIVRC